ncbi:MAG: hypothetical protein R6U70_10185 [Bacillota bacterium]
MGPVALFFLRLYAFFMIVFFGYCLLTTPTSFQRIRDSRTERASRRRRRPSRVRPSSALSDDPWARYTRESPGLLPGGDDGEEEKRY